MEADGSERVELRVEAAAAGTRLDAYLAGAVAGLSRARAKTLIQTGHVALGGATIVEPKRPVKSGEEVAVTLPPPEPLTPAGEAIPLDVVYEDDDLLVINKPAGLVVHSAAGNCTGTLVNALVAHCGGNLSKIGGTERPGIVHRLDKDTTGVMVVAKTDAAHEALAAQFADHGRNGPLERGYRAIVWGAPALFESTLEAPLARSRLNREKMAVVKSGGRAAITHYRVEARYGAKDRKPVAALLDCRLETGRTHQIRVHLAALGHPVIGDRVYGAGFLTKAASLPEPARGIVAAFARQALHAWLLGFAHPATGEEMRFEAPLPADLTALTASLAAL